MHKTCWYTTIHPLRVGAIVGFGGHRRAGAVGALRVSLRRRIPDPRRPAQSGSATRRTYGKEILGDLYEGKRTLPLMHLLIDGHRRRPQLWCATTCGRSRDERSAELVGTVRDLMDTYGSIDFTVEYAEGILSVAEEYFEQAFGEAQSGPDLEFLRPLVPYVWARWR